MNENDMEIELPKKITQPADAEEIKPNPNLDTPIETPVAPPIFEEKIAAEAPPLVAPTPETVDPVPVLAQEPALTDPAPSQTVTNETEPAVIDNIFDSQPAAVLETPATEQPPIEAQSSTIVADPIEPSPAANAIDVPPITEPQSSVVSNEVTLDPVLEPAPPLPDVTAEPAAAPLTPSDNTISQATEQLAIEEIKAPESELNPDGKLEKKLVVEAPVKKEKKAANPIITFLTLLIILGIIVVAFFFFVNQGIIKLPGNLKLPFINQTTTTTAKNEEIKLEGNYSEAKNDLCPDTPSTLRLNAGTFIFTEVTYDSATSTCNSNNITGLYISSNGNLKLREGGGKEYIGTYSKDKENIITLNLTVNEQSLVLTNNNK